LRHEITRENSLTQDQLDSWREYISGIPPRPPQPAPATAAQPQPDAGQPTPEPGPLPASEDVTQQEESGKKRWA
jgi:hypothetical protein